MTNFMFYSLALVLNFLASYFVGPDFRIVVSKRQCYAPCADIVILIVSHKEAALKTQSLTLTYSIFCCISILKS